MAQPPWKDALARARRGDAGLTALPVAVPAAPLAPDELAAAAPGLQGLLAERRALETRMQAITGQGGTGGGGSDPRYAVEPLDRRRAALAAWGESRDAEREGRRTPAAAFAPQAPPLRAMAADVLRGTNADTLRATPGELLADARPGRLIESFGRPLSGAANADPLLRPPGRREAAAPAERGGADPLDRQLARARDMAARARRTIARAERALDQARDAIPAAWQERAREHIPGLGKADPYVRETARKLQVAVGTVDEIGQKADRLRSLARDMRELKDADAAGDEARRERALGRLKAKRQEA